MSATDPVQVFFAPGNQSTYHESESCPRGESLPAFWRFAVDANMDPCGKCAQSFDH